MCLYYILYYIILYIREILWIDSYFLVERYLPIKIVYVCMMDNHTDVCDRIEEKTDFSVRGDEEELEVYTSEDELVGTVEESGFLHKYRVIPANNTELGFEYADVNTVSGVVDKFIEVEK